MHILQLGPYPPPEGGISRNLLAIRDELQHAGHKCSVGVIAKCSKIVPEQDVYHPQNGRGLVRLLLTLKYDVLHVHIGGELRFRVLLLLAVCAGLSRGKNILTFHSGGYAAKKGNAARRFSIVGMVFRRYKKIICVNPSMTEMFEKFGVKKDRLHLIYPFALQDLDQTVEIPDKLREFTLRHRPFLLTVGLLEDTYDLFLQIDAFEKVLQKFPNAGLMIVGSGSLEGDLKKAIVSKLYSDKIFLTGDVEHKITLHLINNCDILLRTTKFDGDAISIREALHLKTSVIATDNGMRPNGVNLIAANPSIDTLVDKITRVLENNIPDKMAENDDGRGNIKAVIDVYKQLVEE